MEDLDALWNIMDTEQLDRLSPEDVAVGYSDNYFQVPIDATKLLIRAISGQELLQRQFFQQLHALIINIKNKYVQFNSQQISLEQSFQAINELKMSRNHTVTKQIIQRFSTSNFQSSGSFTLCCAILYLSNTLINQYNGDKNGTIQIDASAIAFIGMWFL